MGGGGRNWEKLRGFNGAIGLYRFVFSIMVASHHFFDHLGTSYVHGGYMSVTFFFILSGFLAAKSADCSATTTQVAFSSEDTAWCYLKKRLLIFMPQYLFSLFLCVAVKVFYLHVQQIELAPFLMEATLLHGVIAAGGELNHATWFLSALFWCEPIFVYLLKKDREKCLKIIAPVLTLLCYGAIVRYGGNLNIRFGSPLFISNGVLHAVAGLSLGFTLYAIYYSKKKASGSKWVATAIELFTFFVSLCYMIWSGWRKMDFVIAALLAVLIFSSFANESYLSLLTRSRFFSYLQDLSLSIYLLHPAIQFIFVFRLTYLPLWVRALLFLGSTILLSIPVVWLQQRYQTFLKERTKLL